MADEVAVFLLVTWKRRRRDKTASVFFPPFSITPPFEPLDRRQRRGIWEFAGTKRGSDDKNDDMHMELTYLPDHVLLGDWVRDLRSRGFRGLTCLSVIKLVISRGRVNKSRPRFERRELVKNQIKKRRQKSQLGPGDESESAQWTDGHLYVIGRLGCWLQRNVSLLPQAVG